MQKLNEGYFESYSFPVIPSGRQSPFSSFCYEVTIFFNALNNFACSTGAKNSWALRFKVSGPLLFCLLLIVVHSVTQCYMNHALFFYEMSEQGQVQK